MARARALRKQDLRELGWKALVAALGVANATRFVVRSELSRWPQKSLFAKTWNDRGALSVR